ncbi:MAG: sigma-70 family RNA polymerase sigma factor [Candidatus Poribacteria bacterium]|nr:sigma-70 family RNA polymerase sigma factor [Candidatus Poribacteria bacterium]
MKNADVELIQRVRDGDDTAFSELVRKYRKSVHALAWRKIQDFHIAEDITQETFLKAYQELTTLKEPQSFASWLYVIVVNRCNTWLRKKKRMLTQSLEVTDSAELEKATYSSYVVEENERTSVEAKREVVKKLLAKLQESDRTVVTLYYLGGMTYEEISRFLGVSVSAIKNRLYRARKHLQKEEPMIREALEYYQITPHLTENIMREIARLKPAAPTGGKPLVPWAIATSSALLIVLLLGLGSQQLVHFQKPYSLDAQAETTVELVDAPNVLNLEVKVDVQNQLGNTNPLGKSDNNGQKPDEILLASAQAEGENISVPKQQWIQAEPIKGSHIYSLHATPSEEIYTFAANRQIYKLEADGNSWKNIFNVDSLGVAYHPSSPLVKWNNTLYILTSGKLFAIKDDGKTWDLVYSWQNRYDPSGLFLTDQVFYAAFEQGIFRSEDAGKTWESIYDQAHVFSVTNIQNTLFAVTDTGFHRLNADSWEPIKFPDPIIGEVRSIAATQEILYVAVMVSFDVVHPNKVANGLARGWWILRSNDLGNSWEDITPTNAWPVNGLCPYIKLIAAGDTLLVMERGMVRSTDSGNTWMPPQLAKTTPQMNTWKTAAAGNKDIFYIQSMDGLQRTTDGGTSWNKVNITQNVGGIHQIIALEKTDNKTNTLHTLYGRSGNEIVKTTDGGKSWTNVQIEVPMTESDRIEYPKITHIVKSGGVIYAKSGDFYQHQDLRLYRVSANSITLLPIHDRPFFKSGASYLQFELRNNPLAEKLQEKYAGAAQFFKKLVAEPQPGVNSFMERGLQGPFSVSGDTFYMECNFKLFRREPGDKEWQAIGQEETAELSWEIAWKDLKLAISGDTVYVGKRDGRLVVSFNKGNNWVDLTPGLPFQVKTYKDIVVAGSTVCVATDAGIITSDDGKNWSTVTDANGTNLIMEHLADDDTTLYGITKDTGIYRLENATFKQIISDIPEHVTSLAVDGNTLYVGTENRGMLHYNLEE